MMAGTGSNPGDELRMAAYIPIDPEENADEQPPSSFWESISNVCELIMLTFSVLFGCGFVASDLGTDVFIALPAYLANKLYESFAVQVGAICAGVVIGYAQQIANQGMWQKLSRFPKWQRIQLLLGGVLIFPFTPVIVIVQAIIGFFSNDKALLQECKEAVHWVAQGELFECFISFVLQVRAYFAQAVDVKISLVTGVCAATKGALGFDLSSNIRFALRFNKGQGDAATDTDIPILYGLLPGLTKYPGRVLLLAFHRLMEICSGVGCIVLFHEAARAIFTVEIFSREFSLAGPFFVSLQVIMLGILKIGTATSSSLFAVPFTPICVPLPLLDAQVSSSMEYGVRALSQIVVLLFWFFNQGQDYHVVDNQLWCLQNWLTASATVVMWLSLAGLRALPVSSYDETEVEKLVKRMSELLDEGYQLVNADSISQSRSAAEWQHPLAQLFAQHAMAHLGLQEPDAPSSSELKSNLHFAIFCFGKQCGNNTTLTIMTINLRENSTITDEGLAALPKTITAMEIDLTSNSTITDKGLAGLPKTITTMRIDLNDNSTITNKGLAGLPKTITTMTIDLSRNSTITDGGLAALPKTITTMTIHLSENSTITDEGLAGLPKTITTMTIDLYDNSTITDEGLAGLPKTITNMFINLRHNSTITDEGLAALPKTITTMRIILYDNSTITNKGLAAAGIQGLVVKGR